MKKHILHFFMLSLLFFMAADGQAQECCEEDLCYYVKILGGVNFLENTVITENRSAYRSGYIIAGSLGYCWDYGLSFEAEYAFRRNAINEIHFFVEGYSERGHYQASSYMANLFWDLPLSSYFGNFQPFIGAGIGRDFQQMHSSNSRIVFNQKWNHFAWQVMAGITHPLYCNIESTLEYKFHQGGCHFYNHSIGVGIVYKFSFFK